MKDILIKIMLGIGINPPGRFQNKIVDLKTGKLILHPNNNESIDINTLYHVLRMVYTWSLSFMQWCLLHLRCRMLHCTGGSLPTSTPSRT